MIGNESFDSYMWCRLKYFINSPMSNDSLIEHVWCTWCEYSKSHVTSKTWLIVKKCLESFDYYYWCDYTVTEYSWIRCPIHLKLMLKLITPFDSVNQLKYRWPISYSRSINIQVNLLIFSQEESILSIQKLSQTSVG